jgi:glycosyltransferase involved in cell wall biosynthesis
MKYPRVLVLSISRVNAADTSNNGLLLRNLFSPWPRENLAQIYSSADNRDNGFFGRYYRLGSQDRRLGKIFYSLKACIEGETATETSILVPGTAIPTNGSFIKSLGKSLLVDTGLYEIIFRPRISKKMEAWVKEFRPDIIFAQGYTLTFTWLPLMLTKRFNIPIAYYPTDDWPSSEYQSKKSKIPFISSYISHEVTSASRRLIETATVRLAFNRYMQEEYLNRYSKEFTVLMHGDDISRFLSIQPLRFAEPDEFWIVGAGIFDHHRWPLLKDLDLACEILVEKGFKIRATIYPVNYSSAMSLDTTSFRYLHLEPCPSHIDLPAVLRGADILFLPERFGEDSKGIRLSVSSKAHLYMFSGKPIIVYSDPATGISRYAEEEGWAVVVGQRDPHQLATVFEKFISDATVCQGLFERASNTVANNHDLSKIQSLFLNMLSTVIK